MGVDISSILGILTGVVLLFWAIHIGGSLGAFWHPPSLMITLGGTMAATLINYPFGQVVRVFGILRNVFRGGGEAAAKMIVLFVRLAEKARREGILSLEDDAEAMEDDFVRKAIQLVVDGTDPALVRKILETELSFLEDRHRVGQQMFETMGTIAPAFGMTGTLIGLIQMLRNLDRPESIGPGLAVALVTTFYGVLLANLVFLPVAGKLRVRSDEEVLVKELVIEGVLALQAGDNPRIVEERLKAFLSPTGRAGYDGQKEREKAGEREWVVGGEEETETP